MLGCLVLGRMTAADRWRLFCSHFFTVLFASQTQSQAQQVEQEGQQALEEEQQQQHQGQEAPFSLAQSLPAQTGAARRSAQEALRIRQRLVVRQQR